jgi:hypothetical protein
LQVSFPLHEDFTLFTNIYSTRFKLKKQVEVKSDLNFEHIHPTLTLGAQTILMRDRFHFNTSIHILGEYEKYL